MKLTPHILDRLRDTYANRHEPESLRVFAGIYWRSVLGIALVLVTAIFFYSMWNLASVLNELSAVAASSPQPPSAFDRAGLNASVQALDARQTQFDALKAHPVPISDPSR